MRKIPAPPADFEGHVRYAVRAREKRAYSTVLDAHRLLASSVRPFSEVRHESDGNDVVITADHPMVDGRLREEFRFVRSEDGLVVRTLHREVFDANGRSVRNELVPDFRHEALGLPLATYPEVALPFLLGWMPHDSERRTFYAWTNDRFVAKVYVEVAAHKPIVFGGRAHDVVKVVMYPDLNDWVPLGGLLTKLSKPLLPKYHMWYDRKVPYRLVRFEGAYGPPGAPEVVLEAAVAPA
jgi:hypothetical protein